MISHGSRPSFGGSAHSAFPWGALPRVAADEVAQVRAVRRVFAGVSARGVGDAVKALTGHATTVAVRRRAKVARERLELGTRGVVTMLAGEGALVAIEIEAELALAVVGALAGKRSLPKIARDRRVSPEVAGALAGVVQHLARACGFDGEIAAIDAQADEVRAGFTRDPIVLDAAVSIGALRTLVHVAVTAPPLAYERTRPRDVLVRMETTPISLFAVLGAAWISLAEIAVVDVGDVVVIDGLVRSGACFLAASNAETGVAIELADGPRGATAKIGATRVQLAPVREAHENAGMGADSGASGGNEATVEIAAYGDGGPLVDALVQAPVMVRAELGAATLAAHEWAAIGVGDVVVLDRRVGESVSLRVNGKVIARGELVDVDGALGVRIVERMA